MPDAQALRDSEELHRITLLNMSDAVFITNDDGDFTFVCPNVDVIFGHGEEEVRAMGRISLLLGAELVDRARLGAEGEVRNIEHEVATKHGMRRALLVHIKQVSIKGGTTLYVCRDITERKQAEHALKRNEQRLSLALEAASMGTWDWDVPTGEMNWSPETHRMFGDTSGGMSPSFETFLARVHPSDRDRVSHAMNDAMERGDSYETEFRVVGYDNVLRWVLGKGKALRNGKPLRMLGVFVDFTEHHHLEDELRALSGRLIQAHEEERNRIARELHDDVAQRLSVLGIELATLSHHPDALSSGLQQSLAGLAARTATLGADLHRVSHELHPATLEQVGLEAGLRSFCRELSQSHRFAIDVNVHRVPHPLPNDVALCLYRVAQEALNNAVRHSQSQGAIVRLTGTADALLLSVTDHGGGFDPEFRGDRAALGLRSMRERVRLVGGQFTVQSRAGSGTRIEALVPVQRPEHSDRPVPLEARPRVLLADDYPGLLDAWERLLVASCEIVGRVRSGRDVLDATRALEPDVVVVDVAMPDVNGIEACREIRSTRPETAVILVTAADDAEVRTAAREVGASAFLLKYAVADELEPAIQRAFQSRSRTSPPA
jgi:PAS domain S-box-containing protein